MAKDFKHLAHLATALIYQAAIRFSLRRSEQVLGQAMKLSGRTLRINAARTIDDHWGTIAKRIDTFAPTESQYFFAAAGHDCD